MSDDEHEQEHHSSEGSEDLDNQNNTDENQNDSDDHENDSDENQNGSDDNHDSDEQEEQKQPETHLEDVPTVDHVHGDVKRGKGLEKDGYDQVEQTTRDLDDSMNDIHDDELPQDPMMDNSDRLVNNNMGANLAQMNVGSMSEEAKQQMMQQFSHMNDENVVDVIQSCLDGQFKPFLACVQMGFIDKDFIVDETVGRRVIHLIAHYGNIKALRVLHEICEADIEAKDYQGLNAIHYSAGSGEIETLKYLCEKVSEDVIEERDTVGMTPLMHAASKNSIICFIYLYLRKNADIRTVDKKACNVIHWASYSGSLPILKICNQVGVLRDYKDKQDDLQQTPLIKSFFNKNTAAMKYLMEANCNLYIRDYRNNTPEEFILRYLKDPILFEPFLRNKYRQFIKYAINCSEIKKGFVKDIYFVEELCSIYYSKYSHILPTLLFGTLLAVMFLTNVYYSFATGSQTGMLLGLFRVLFYIFLVVSVATYGLMMKAEVHVIQKRDLYDDNSIIQEMLNNIEDGNFSKLVPLKEICFDTNIRKIKHAEYCEKSDQYVLEYQKYCAFLDRPIGDGNAHLYLIWLGCSLILMSLFNISMLGCYWSDSKVIFYYRFWDCIYNIYDQSLFFFIIYLIIQIACCNIFQNFLWMFHAVGRRQTINEVKNSHNYRYIYKRVLDQETKNYLYVHRYYSYCDTFSNVWKFINDAQRPKVNADNPETDSNRFSNISMSSMTTDSDRHEITIE